MRAGEHRVAAAFVKRTEGPYEDLIKPHEWSLRRRRIGRRRHHHPAAPARLIVAGPYNATGVSETPSRQRIFTCRPTSQSEERACARSIIARLAGEAYRRPLTTPKSTA